MTHIVIIEKSGSKEERRKEREKETAWRNIWFADFSNAHKLQSWATLKLEVWNSILVSHLGHRSSFTWPIIYHFHAAFDNSCIRNRVIRIQTGTPVWYIVVQQLNPLSHNIVSLQTLQENKDTIKFASKVWHEWWITVDWHRSRETKSEVTALHYITALYVKT